MNTKMTDLTKDLTNDEPPNESPRIHELLVKELAVGTFLTKHATVEIHREFLIVSFLDEYETRIELRLDLSNISMIKQTFEIGRNMVNFTLRPNKVQEIAKKIPKEFKFSIRDPLFLITFPDELSENVIADLKNILSSIPPKIPPFDDFGKSEADVTKLCTTEEISDENAAPNGEKLFGKSDFRKAFGESPEADGEKHLENLGKRSFLGGEKTFDDDSMRYKRVLRNRDKEPKMSKIEVSDYYENDDIPEQLREAKKTVQKKPRPTNTEFDAYNNAETLIIYPPGSNNLITMENYKCLDRRELIDDVILDFYIQYIYNEMMSDDMRKRVHICSSSFYSLYSTQANFAGWKDGETGKLKAPEKRYLRVKDLPCVKDANLFEKDFIVFPCHSNDHWFLVIACYPKMNGAFTLKDEVPVEGDALIIDRKNPNAGEPVKRSCLVAFDSVRSNPTRRSRAMIHIRNFLASDYNEKYQNKFTFWPETIYANSALCPQQSNATDCGLFLLEFVERFFISSPMEDFRFNIDVSDWFSQEIILQKREHIATVIQALIVQQKGELPDLPPISFSGSEPDIEIIGEMVKVIDENNGNNNNEEEFNNNNDFNAVDHNKASNVDSVQETESQTVPNSRSEEGMKFSLDLLNQKIQGKQSVEQHAENSNEPGTSLSYTEDDDLDEAFSEIEGGGAESSQISLFATQSSHSSTDDKLSGVPEKNANPIVIEIDSD